MVERFGNFDPVNGRVSHRISPSCENIHCNIRIICKKGFSHSLLNGNIAILSNPCFTAIMRPRQPLNDLKCTDQRENDSTYLKIHTARQWSADLTHNILGQNHNVALPVFDTVSLFPRLPPPLGFAGCAPS